MKKKWKTYQTYHWIINEIKRHFSNKYSQTKPIIDIDFMQSKRTLRTFQFRSFVKMKTN